MAKDISNMGYNLFVKEERDKRFVPMDCGNNSRTNKATYSLSIKGAMRVMFDLINQANWNRIAIEDYDALPKAEYQIRNEKGEMVWNEVL